MIEVIHSVSIMNRAGQETLLMNIMRNIDLTKVHFSFLCSVDGEGDYDEEIRRLGGNIYDLGQCCLHRVKYLNYLGDIYVIYRFFSLHRCQFQIFQIHNYHSFNAFLQVLGAKLARVPKIIVHSHNSNALHPFLHSIFRKILNRMNIECFACSHLAAEWMFGNKGDKAYIVKNGIMVNDYVFDNQRRDKLRRQLGFQEGQLIVGHIGRFNYQKNHMFLLDIFKNIHLQDFEAKLILVGCGELENSIKQRIKELGLEHAVVLLGIRNDIPDLLCAFDVFLFPSLFEGLSVVLVEAQTTGLPCIISDTNSKEVKLTDNIHMLSLKAPVEEWADAVLKYRNMQRHNNADIMRKQGYDIKDTARILCQKYENIINE